MEGTLKTPNRLARKRVKFNGKVVSVKCPFCPRNPITTQWYHATQNHITSHCVRMNGMITNRHNKVLQMVEDALTDLNKNTNFRKEPLISGTSSKCKPDLVLQKPFGKTISSDYVLH